MRSVRSCCGLSVRVEAEDVVGFRAVELQRLRGRAFLELQRQHAHADEVAAVDALETLRDDRFHAEQIACLWPPNRANCPCRIPVRPERPAACLRLRYFMAAS